MAVKPVIHGSDHAPRSADSSFTERWHLFGAAGEPALVSPWVETGGTDKTSGYKLVVGPPTHPQQSLELVLNVTGGADGDLIVTLPAEVVVWLDGFDVRRPAINDDGGTWGYRVEGSTGNVYAIAPIPGSLSGLTDVSGTATTGQGPVWNGSSFAMTDIATQAELDAETASRISGDAASVTETRLSFSDITTANASTSQHGLLRKLDGNTTHFLDGNGGWTTPAGLGTGIPEALIDAKGDLIVGTADDTAARLPVGTNGYVLTADSTVTDGVKWAVAPGAGSLWTEISKASDESVTSSTALQNDDDLFFTATSTAVYEIELTLIYGSPAGGGTPDLKLDLGEGDLSPRGTVVAPSLSTADSIQSGLIRTNSSDVLQAGTDTLNRTIRIMGSHVGGGGTFRLRWAQNSSNGNATIMRAGSVLRYRRLV